VPAVLTSPSLRDVAPGVALSVAAVLALVVANSPWQESYLRLLQFPLGAGSLLLWVNDGLMAVFFLFVGLEIKRELVGGELSSRRQVLLSLVAAFGGMALPALIYLALNFQQPPALRGWAIPCATDIAFALGGLGLSALTDSITLGILLGPVAGKAAGIFAAGWLLFRLGWADRPAATGDLHFFGVACLCGIGFTMSLFIGSPAFGDTGRYSHLVKMGVMGGSLISATVGLFILRLASGPPRFAPVESMSR